MPLHAKAVSIEPVTDRRGERRFLLDFTTTLENASKSQIHATVHNISQTGLLIEAPFALDVGGVLQINLPAAGLQVARVVWADNGLHGCKFDTPIPTAKLSAELLVAPFNEPRDRAARNLRSTKLPLRTRFLTVIGLALLSWGLVAIVFVAVL